MENPAAGKRNNFQHENIRKRIIVPFSVLILLILFFCAYGAYTLQQYHLQQEVDAKIAGVNRLFDRFLAQEAKFMQAQLAFLADDQDLLREWQNRNRRELYRIAQPLFAGFWKDFGVTHFYFIEPSGICFLRVHAPSLHGDTINRYTLRRARTDGLLAYGIELGPLGTFTLRVVLPWIDQNKTIGYIELGEEIEHLTPQMKRISNLDLIFTANKSELDREKWESGLLLLGKKERWDDFADFVVIDQTIKEYGPQLKKILAASHHGLDPSSRNLLINGRIYRLAAIPLVDATNKEVGKLTALFDITDRINTLKHLMFSSMVILLLFSGAVFIFFFNYAGKIEKQLADYHEHLENKVAARTAELRKALAEVKTLSGLVPICSFCKKIRDDKGYWQQIESYLRDHSDAQFSHGVCEECLKKHYPEIS